MVSRRETLLILVGKLERGMRIRTHDPNLGKALSDPCGSLPRLSLSRRHAGCALRRPNCLGVRRRDLRSFRVFCAPSVPHLYRRSLSQPVLSRNNVDLLQHDGGGEGGISNPRYPCEYAAFRVRCFQPLSHLSEPGARGRRKLATRWPRCKAAPVAMGAALSGFLSAARAWSNHSRVPRAFD